MVFDTIVTWRHWIKCMTGWMNGPQADNGTERERLDFRGMGYPQQRMGLRLFFFVFFYTQLGGYTISLTKQRTKNVARHNTFRVAETTDTPSCS